MKIKLHFCWLLTSTLFLFSCNQKTKKPHVQLQLSVKDSLANEIEIGTNKYLNYLILSKVKPDSTGSAIVQLKIDKPTFAYLSMGRHSAELYLAPDYDLHVEIETGPYGSLRLRFEGRGAAINNYLAQASLLSNFSINSGGRNITGLEQAAFFARFDSLKNKLNTFHQHYIDSLSLITSLNLEKKSTKEPSLSENENQVLQERIEIKLLSFRQEYVFMKYNNALVDQRYALKEGKEIVPFKLSTELQNIVDEMPLDTVGINLGLAEYRDLSQMYLSNKIFLPSYDVRTWDKVKYHYPLKAIQTLKEGNYPEAIREYLIAQALQYYLVMQGITPATDSIFNDFKKNYSTSLYKAGLKKDYDEWSAILPGQLAPDFNGFDSEGKKIYLHDLRGKVVYVDVWATWCGPCLDEIPHSKKIISRFENNENVAFLNVSVDRDHKVWLKMITEKKDWKGIHINLAGGQIDSLFSSYKMGGVPTYILIDQKGKLVKAQASSPSEGKISEELFALLNQFH